MRRNGTFRGLAGLLSIWLAICLAEPAQLHTCAMHGQLAMEAMGMHAGSHHASAHAGHDVDSRVSAGHSHDKQESSDANQCTCLGDCSAGRTLVGVVSTPASFAAAVVYRPAVAFSYSSPSVVAPSFLLPFSHGPPAASSRA